MADSGIKHIDVGAELTKVEWESEANHEIVHGTSFPGSPVERQLYYRDDEHKWYVYNGTSWVETTSQGVTDHGGLGGLADDDHTQYTKHSLATAISDFLVASGAGVFIKKTLAEVKTILGLGTAAYTAATDYVTHALATAANDFLVASGSGAFVKKTLAEVKTLLDWATDIATHAGLTTGTHGVGAGTVGILNKDTKIVDADADTGIETERTSDDDILYLKTGGVDCGKFSALGILTLAKQSSANAYTDTQPIGGQKIPDATWIKIMFTAVHFDVQSELDISYPTGTAEDLAGANLKDTGAFTEAEAYYLGRTAYNHTDGTYTTVTGKTDNDTLTLADDIFDNGETYYLFFSRFTAKEDGLCLIFGQAYYYNTQVVADKRYSVAVYKNGVAEAASYRHYHSSHVDFMSAIMLYVVELSATDYIELWTRHTGGSTKAIGSGSNNFVIYKLA